MSVNGSIHLFSAMARVATILIVYCPACVSYWESGGLTSARDFGYWHGAGTERLLDPAGEWDGTLTTPAFSTRRS